MLRHVALTHTSDQVAKPCSHTQPTSEVVVPELSVSEVELPNMLVFVYVVWQSRTESESHVRDSGTAFGGHRASQLDRHMGEASEALQYAP